MITQAQVNRLHELVNDIYLNIHDIRVIDESGRNARQSAICNTMAARRLIDDMGLRHDVVDTDRAASMEKEETQCRKH